MRPFSVLVSLGFIASVIAAPAPVPQPKSLLFSKDPLSVHKRAVIPTPEDVEALAYDPEAASKDESVPTPESDLVAVDVAVEGEADEWEDEESQVEEPCANVCGVKWVEGAKSEKEALCSADGLKATYACAQCIDEYWPVADWGESAKAEYERIASACDDSPQRPIRRQSV